MKKSKKLKKEKTVIIRMIHQKKNKPVMGKIGVNRSEELKNN